MFAVPPNTIALPAELAAAHPVRTAIEVARDRARWAHLLRFDPDQRFSTLIDANGDVEIWLLSWLPGQDTGPHDHGAAVGAFTVVLGTLTERVLRPGDTVVRPPHPVRAGQARVFGPGYAHDVRNDGTEPAVSIHVYRPCRTVKPRTALR